MNKIKLSTIKESLNVITGCGSGLGRATLLWFLKHGSGPILGIDRKFDQDYQKNLNLNEEDHSKLLLREHDTFDEKVENSISEFVSKHGTIDNVINVAGVALAFGLWSPHNTNIYSLDHAENLLKFNTVGTFNMIRLISKYMIDSSHKVGDKGSKPRCIVNASCMSTSKPSYGQTFYVGTNAAIDSMTLCIARELSPFNIRCNTINVGHFDTRLLQSSDIVLQYLALECAQCPRRLGSPEEFAHLVQATIENPMLNGCCIRLDGLALPAIDSSP